MSLRANECVERSRILRPSSLSGDIQFPCHDGETCKPKSQRLQFVLQYLWTISCHHRRQNSSNVIPDAPRCIFFLSIWNYKSPPFVEKVLRILLNIHMAEIGPAPKCHQSIWRSNKPLNPNANLVNLGKLHFFQRSSVYNKFTDALQQERKEAWQKCVVCFSTPGAPNSSLIKNAKPLLHEREERWVPLQIHGGRGLLSLLYLPSQLGILLIAPLPSPVVPAPSFPPLFFFFSVGVHFETPLLWWVKGLTS